MKWPLFLTSPKRYIFYKKKLYYGTSKAPWFLLKISKFTHG